MAAATEVGDKNFKPGEAVRIKERIRLNLFDLPDKTWHRQQVPMGTKGIIKGFCHEHVFVEVLIEAYKKKTLKIQNNAIVIVKTFPKNLERASVYEAIKKDKAISKAAETREDPPAIEETHTGFEWLSEHPSVSDLQAEVRVEKQWEKFISDQDDVARGWALKGKISMGLMTLYETLPKFTPKDLVVCHRQSTGNGFWNIEVWTHRDFKPRELIIGAISTDIRSRNWSPRAFALVGLPRQGPSRHPEGTALAIDGRGQGVLAASKTIDEEEHRGCIFWAIKRVYDPTQEHNLILNMVTWDASMSFQLPGGKKRKMEHHFEDLPQLPVITNPKEIKARTPLVLYQDLRPSRSRARKRPSND